MNIFEKIEKLKIIGNVNEMFEILQTKTADNTKTKNEGKSITKK